MSCYVSHILQLVFAVANSILIIKIFIINIIIYIQVTLFTFNNNQYVRHKLTQWVKFSLISYYMRL